MDYVFDGQHVLAPIRGQWIRCKVVCACGDMARVANLDPAPTEPKSCLERVAGIEPEGDIDQWFQVDRLRETVCPLCGQKGGSAEFCARCGTPASREAQEAL